MYASLYVLYLHDFFPCFIWYLATPKIQIEFFLSVILFFLLSFIFTLFFPYLSSPPSLLPPLSLSYLYMFVWDSFYAFLCVLDLHTCLFPPLLLLCARRVDGYISVSQGTHQILPSDKWRFIMVTIKSHFNTWAYLISWWMKFLVVRWTGMNGE